VVYVREDVTAANHSLDTGVPISIASPRSKIEHHGSNFRFQRSKKRCNLRPQIGRLKCNVSFWLRL
jgi:hypothetical protein